MLVVMQAVLLARLLHWSIQPRRLTLSESQRCEFGALPFARASNHSHRPGPSSPLLASPWQKAWGKYVVMHRSHPCISKFLALSHISENCLPARLRIHVRTRASPSESAL